VVQGKGYVKPLSHPICVVVSGATVMVVVVVVAFSCIIAMLCKGGDDTR
jgi:hypothetical protein